MKILALAGSPSVHSRSTALLRYATDQSRKHGLFVQELGLRDIPASDLVLGAYAGSAAMQLRADVQQAGAVIVATPVYKASFSGGLKAVLDLLDTHSLTDKVVLPLATGGSPAHLLALEYSLKPVLSALGARHILSGIYAHDKQVALDEHGGAQLDKDIMRRLDAAVRRLVELVRPPASVYPAYDLGKLVAASRCGI